MADHLMDDSKMDKTGPTTHVHDVEHGKASEAYLKKSDRHPEKAKANTYLDEVSGRGISWDTASRGEFSGERTIVLIFRPLQLRRIEALQDAVLKFQVELAATKLAGDAVKIAAKEKEIDDLRGPRLQRLLSRNAAWRYSRPQGTAEYYSGYVDVSWPHLMV
jgi:hypothetical protein